MDETDKAKSSLTVLNSLLDDLSDSLDPLFAQSLPDTLLPLSDIQQAKLQTVIPYIVYDLVFIYLKSAGIDPRSHSVVPELERVRQYFEKIKHTETDQSRNTAIDKEAAARFIKHAISQASTLASSSASKPGDDQTPQRPTSQVPLKVTQKMMDRAKYHEDLADQDDQDDDNQLQVFDDDSPQLVEEGPSASKKQKIRHEPPPPKQKKKQKKK